VLLERRSRDLAVLSGYTALRLHSDYLSPQSLIRFLGKAISACLSVHPLAQSQKQDVKPIGAKPHLAEVEVSTLFFEKKGTGGCLPGVAQIEHADGAFP